MREFSEIETNYFDKNLARSLKCNIVIDKIVIEILFKTTLLLKLI